MNKMEISIYRKSKKEPKRNSEAEKYNNSNEKFIRFKGRVEQAGERISKLEYRTTEIIKSEKHKEERLKKSDQSLRDLWKPSTYALWESQKKK